MTQVTFLRSIGRYKANETYELKTAIADFFVKKAKLAMVVDEVRDGFDDLLDLDQVSTRAPNKSKKQKRKQKNLYATREMKANN